MGSAVGVRVLLLGVHSALNRGDDAIMAQTLRYLKESFPSVTVTIAASDPQSWQHYAGSDVQIVGSLAHGVVDRTGGSWRWRKEALAAVGIRTMVKILQYRVRNRMDDGGQDDLSRLLSVYASADKVYVCGGGNLYTQRQLSVAFLWLVFSIAVSVWLRKPTAMLPQSIGPVVGWGQRAVLRWLVDRMDIVMVRELESRAFLRSLGCRASPIVLPDLAFGLPPVYKAAPHSSERWLGLTVMDFGAQNSRFEGQRAYEDALVEAVWTVTRSSCVPVRVFVFVQCFGPSQDQDDRGCSRRVYERLRAITSSVQLVDQEADAQSLRQRYAEMDCMIGTRMHTAIFAASGGVPLILVAYQPKAVGTMHLLGLSEYVCNIHDLTGQRLAALIASAHEHRVNLTEGLRLRYLALNAELEQIRSYLRGLG